MKNSKQYNIRALSLCSLFCSLIILGAYVRLPFPIPVTLQLLFTNTAALLLGKKWSWVPPLLYLTLGLAGLPVFTSGGGVSSVLSLSFGYCVGFIPGSLVAGIISDKDAGARSLTLASICNLACVYLCAVVHYLLLCNIYLSEDISITYAIYVCVLPFLFADIAKLAVSVILAKKLRRHIKKQPTT